MRVRLDKSFPYNICFGVLTANKFEHKPPGSRNELLKHTKCPEFREFVHQECQKIQQRTECDRGYKEVCDIFNVQLIIKKDGNVTTFGEGKNF